MLSKVAKVLKDPLLPFRANVYGVGVVDNYVDKDILGKEMENIRWITPNHGGDFYADPFITDYFGEPIIFFEYWFDKEHRGNISYAYLRDIKSSKEEVSNPAVHTALNLSTHLSYPHLFEYKGTLYMIPENYQSHTISLYKSNGSPDKWEKVSTFVDNFDGVDTNVFEFDGKWWMFSTLRIEGTPSENSDLYIWYSDNPLGGWIPHKMNPIKYSEPVARGAGKPFMADGKLYRPAQDCTRTYGGELLIKEITKLTPDEFEEKTVRKFSGHAPFAESYHTYNSCGAVSVIDGTQSRYSMEHGVCVAKGVLAGKYK